MTFEPTSQPLEYYARPGFMTDPGDYRRLFDGLPTDIAALCHVVQGLPAPHLLGGALRA